MENFRLAPGSSSEEDTDDEDLWTIKLGSNKISKNDSPYKLDNCGAEKSTRRSSRKSVPPSFYGMNTQKHDDESNAFNSHDYDHRNLNIKNNTGKRKSKRIINSVDCKRNSCKRVKWDEEATLYHSKLSKNKQGMDELSNYYIKNISRKVNGLSWYDSVLKNDPDPDAKKIRRWCMDRRNYLRPYFIKSSSKTINDIYARKVIDMCKNLHDTLSIYLIEAGTVDKKPELLKQEKKTTPIIPDLYKINSLLGALNASKSHSNIEKEVERLKIFYMKYVSKSPSRDWNYHSLLKNDKSDLAKELKLWCKQKRKYMKPILLGKRPSTSLSERSIELLSNLFDSLCQKNKLDSKQMIYKNRTPVEKLNSVIGSITTVNRQTVNNVDCLGEYYKENASMKGESESWYLGVLLKDKSMRAEKLKGWCYDRRKIMKLYFLDYMRHETYPNTNAAKNRAQQAAMYVQLYDSLKSFHKDKLPSFELPIMSEFHKIISLIGSFQVKEEEISSYPQNVEEDINRLLIHYKKNFSRRDYNSIHKKMNSK